jgi:hypothetical protein
MWDAFRAVLVQHSSETADEVICNSAGETFDRLHDWFAVGSAE